MFRVMSLRHKSAMAQAFSGLVAHDASVIFVNSKTLNFVG